MRELRQHVGLQLDFGEHLLTRKRAPAFAGARSFFAEPRRPDVRIRCIDPILPLRQLIPPITLRTVAGQVLHSWEFKQKKNLVIAFFHAECRSCEGYLRGLAARAGELQENNAAALIVFSIPPPAALGDLPAPIRLGADASGRSHRAYLGGEAFSPAGLDRLGLFVADRYGELFAGWIAREATELPELSEIFSALLQVQILCEECGVSNWPRD